MKAERLYTVLLEPHFSEKVSILGDQSNQYGFKVATDATKEEIKEAVEELFKVSVQRVSTVNVKGKVKRTARGKSRGKNWKKAYVRVAEGQEIDFMVSD
jgi:large subunit ribosomal protein L23